MLRRGHCNAPALLMGTHQAIPGVLLSLIGLFSGMWLSMTVLACDSVVRCQESSLGLDAVLGQVLHLGCFTWSWSLNALG